MAATNPIKSTLRVLQGAVNTPLGNDDHVQRAQGGDVASIRELYLSHHAAIFRFIWSRVHDPDLADDLTGEVFIRMIKSLPGYEDRSLPFRAWLYGIARNLVIDHFRKVGPRVTVPFNTLDDEAGTDVPLEERANQAVTLEQVRQALALLDSDEREVVELRFLAGLSLKETAITVQKSIAAVKALQHRGIVSLKARIPA